MVGVCISGKPDKVLAEWYLGFKVQISIHGYYNCIALFFYLGFHLKSLPYLYYLFRNETDQEANFAPRPMGSSNSNRKSSGSYTSSGTSPSRGNKNPL